MKLALPKSGSGAFVRLRALGAHGLLMLAVAVILLPIVDVAICWAGWRRTCRVLRKFVPIAPRKIVNDTDIQRLSAVVRIAGTRSPWRATCLRQAVALWFLLALRGVECDLRIGVADRTDAGIDTHAWLEHDGIVLIGGETSPARYRVMV